MSINPTQLSNRAIPNVVEVQRPETKSETTLPKPAKITEIIPANAASKFMSSPNKLASRLDRLVGGLAPRGGGGGSSDKTSAKKTQKAKDKPQSEDDLLTGLFKIFLAALKIPSKFEKMFEGVTNAGLSLGTGLEGIFQSTFLGIEDLVYLVIVIYTIASKYFNCFILFLVNLPSCFISHVITCVFSVLYLIFPLTAWIFRTLTGFDLMPHFDKAFEVIYDGDDMLAKVIGFNFLKFPPSIIKQCYTCNGKVIKLRDILKDVSKIKDVGDKIAYDMTKTVPRFMKPAMPYIYKTANAVDEVFFQ
jgi:hypothetical protein